MSFTRFLEKPEVRAKLAPLRPKPPRRIPTALVVEPGSKRYMVVGTAFDYFLRFELQRRAPHAVANRWVAESVPDEIWKTDEKGSRSYISLHRDEKGVISRAVDPNGDWHSLEELAKEVAARVRNVVENAKLAHGAYLKNTSPTRTEQANLAGHAIRLAKLDDASCSPRFDSTFEEAAVEDVEDLLALLAIVPFNKLLHDKTLILNPHFGQTSQQVGGANADLIVDDMLVDFKTTKSTTMGPEHLDQLLSYFLLARRQHQVDPTFPAINRLALYFCRHGYLWIWDTTTWTEHPEFTETEEWFFNHAKQERANLELKAKTQRTARSGEQVDPDANKTLAELIKEGKLKVAFRP